MHLSIDNLNTLSKFRKNISINNVVVDFIKDSDIDWLDLSKPFIPFVSWLETGFKASVDYPKELLLESKQSLSNPLFINIDSGSVCTAKIEKTNVIYHGLIYNTTSKSNTLNLDYYKNKYIYNSNSFMRFHKTFYMLSGFMKPYKKEYKKQKKNRFRTSIKTRKKNTLVAYSKILLSTKRVNPKIIRLNLYKSKLTRSVFKKITKRNLIRKGMAMINKGNAIQRMMGEQGGIGLFSKSYIIKPNNNYKQYKQKLLSIIK